MKKFSIITAFIAFLLLTISCDYFAEEKLPDQFVDTKCDCEGLPGYKWLQSRENFGTESHKDSLLHYFHNSLENERYDDAVWYLAAYGEGSAGTFQSDSFYF